ncbi:MAG TPA: GNAT family N-acetyltransferase [Caulobacteraceae bacterium]|jgi:ribosomal protein S18 acetylase RimI-like enzyme|nr:GNAT family N-acetyltransferase [Caulobacteraceae bacterium]
MTEVTLATAEDAAWLDAHQPSGGMPDVHRQRLALQEAGDAAYLIGWRDGRRVGFVLVHFRHPRHHLSHLHFPDCAYVEGLEVETGARRLGVGRALMHEAEIRARPAADVGLSVGVDNAPARALYRKLGYRPAAIPDYPVTWNYIDRVTGEIGEEGEVCSFWLKPLGL